MRTQELNPAAARGDIREREIRATPETRPLNPQTVAVLPFHNQSADAEQEYFCDGITDDIIHALSRIPGLNVIGHASVFAFKGVAQEARDVSAMLGAGTVVGGTVRKSGDRLKVFTEMLDATTEEVLWAQTYERTLNDVFAVEGGNRGRSSPSPADEVSP